MPAFAWSPADGAVLVAYGVAVVTLGLWAGRRVEGREGLHLAGRRLPTAAVLGSMVATELSAATFLGVPQASFAGDWSYLQLAFGALLGKLAVAHWVIPRYHALGVVTVYGFIGGRFGAGARRACALAFVAGRLLASGARLFIAASAVGVAIDLPVEAAIVLCGGLAALYTGIGGLRSVVYTDLLQAGVFLGAAAVLLAVAIGADGPGAWLAWAGERGATNVFDWGLPRSAAESGSFWVALPAGAFLALATSGTDHDMAQRLLGARSGRAGGRALLGSALANFPITLLFLAVGTGLAFAEDAGRASGLATATSPVPAFALAALPAGLRGLVFAGLLAAAMSSLDSAMAAIAATWSEDLSGGGDLRRSRGLALAAALGLVGAALAMAAARRAQVAAGEASSLVEFALSAMTLVYGGLLGVFALGWTSRRRGSDASVRAGLATGCAAGCALFVHPFLLDTTIVAWTWWIPISAALAFAVAATGRTAADGLLVGPGPRPEESDP